MSDSFNIAALIPMTHAGFDEWLGVSAVGPSKFPDWESMFEGWYWADTKVVAPPRSKHAAAVRDVLAKRAIDVRAHEALLVARHDGQNLVFFDMSFGVNHHWTQQAIAILRQAQQFVRQGASGFIVYWADASGRLPKAKSVISMCRVSTAGSSFVQPRAFRRRGSLERALESLMPAEQTFADLASEADDEDSSIALGPQYIDPSVLMRRGKPERATRAKPSRPSEIGVSAATPAAFNSMLRAENERRVALEQAVIKGNLAGVRVALQGLSSREAEAALSVVDFDWNDMSVNRNVWSLASELLRYRPTWKIAASLVVSAFKHRMGIPDAKTRAMATRVLAWARPYLPRTTNLAGQIAIVGVMSPCLHGKAALAAEVFDYLIAGRNPAAEIRAPLVADGLWSALSQNNGRPIDRARLRRFLRRAADHPKDRFVRFNAGCVAIELGNPRTAVKHFRAALALGMDRGALDRDLLFASLRDEPAFAQLVGNEGQSRRGRKKPVTTGLLPP
ncbi:MAG: hypothetical protein HY901_23585 [Deltaproteobacteria bacterium]|nr:hypothetical protein [Deltaproteobacteria bacterium]